MILLMGIAGSGKGTQGKMLADRHNLHLISMGDMVRQYATDDQRQRMLAGELLRDQEAIAIIDKVLNSLNDDDEVILDGFPRSIPQAQWLLDQVKDGRFKLSRVFHLVASQEAVKARLLNRARIDDNDEAIEERFKEYERSTTPLLEWFAQNGVAVTEVNAERPMAEVSDDLVKALSK